MKSKQTRKEKFQDRSNRYGDANGHMGGSSQGIAFAWQDGYKAALADVRGAVGKCGIPSSLVKLLRPIR